MKWPLVKRSRYDSLQATKATLADELESAYAAADMLRQSLINIRSRELDCLRRLKLAKRIERRNNSHKTARHTQR